MLKIAGIGCLLVFVVWGPTGSTQAGASRQPGEISKKKCVEYAQYVYVTETQPILADRMTYYKKDECAVKAVPLIAGGTKALTKEFPHMALLGYETAPDDFKWLCGGSLISDRYVLTAANCLHSKDYGNPTHVKMGITNLNDKEYLQILRVSEVVPHPDYSPPSVYNDIALLKLETPAKLNPHVRPACLHPEQNISIPKALVTGWGNQDYVAGEPSEDLLKATLEAFGTEECKKSYGSVPSRRLKVGIVEETQLCYGSHTEVKDSCNGDSGGPLQIPHQDGDAYCMYDIIGVTSFGKACALNNVPGVYTRVYPFIKWIEDIVWKQ